MTQNRKRILLLIVLLTASAWTVPAVAQDCLTYEPDKVVLPGTIRRHTFPGPPNYESVARGDAREDVWVLRLSKPICVSASADWERESNVTDVQLVLAEGQKQYDQYRPFLGKSVAVSGTLFQGHTGHHHTRVLLTVGDIQKVVRK